jgi:hypothetical protein
MKLRILTISIISTLLIASCATAVVEEAPAGPVVEEGTGPAVEDSDANIEKVDDPETMEDESTTDSLDTGEVSFSTDIWPIIEAEALSAHGGSGGVFLESYEDIMKYVVPEKPEESQLYKALIGDGHRLMPPNGPLPDEQIQLFFDWISQGAKDN